MPRFAVVSRERHGLKKWQRFNGYAFAAADALVPVVGAELARAAVSMPLAFSEQSGRATLVALLSLVPGHNMFVDPRGRWLGGPYVPAWLRLYPFRMLPQQDTGELVLCVDEESGLVVERNAAGEEFFDREGNLSPALKPVSDALTVAERSRSVIDSAVTALAQAGVIRPWQINVKTDQGEKAISGLQHIDDAALRALPDDVFLKLRTTPALPIAYAQMLSAVHLGRFEHLAKLHNQPPPSPLAALPETLDGLLENLNDDLMRFH
jgi:hypothetical protein